MTTPLPIFTESFTCTSRVHCAKCRDPQAVKWRTSLAKAYTLPDNNANFACPHGKPWDGEKPKSRGLGDTVAKITKAVGIKPCGGCKKRQAALNKLVPYKD